MTQPAGCRRPRTQLRPSWTVLPDAQLCTQSPKALRMVHCLTLAERVCCPLLWMAAHPRAPSPSASRPPAAVTSIADCRRLGSPHCPLRSVLFVSRPRRSDERVRSPCPRRAVCLRAPPPLALVQSRLRALLLHPYCHHRLLGRRLPTASSVPSPSAVGSPTTEAHRAARPDSSIGLAWLSGAICVERIVSPQQPRTRAGFRRRSRRRWTLILNSYSPLAQPACWRLSVPAMQAARARSRKCRTPPATSTSRRRVLRRVARRR